MSGWYMVRVKKTNQYLGPYDEGRAKKEAAEQCAATQDDVEAFLIPSRPAFAARWKGVVIDDERDFRGGPNDR